jgi:threonine synthase
MRFISVNKLSSPVSFREALLNGIAPDGGLYVPETIPQPDAKVFESNPTTTLHTIGTEILSAFIDDIPKNELKTIVAKAWNFPIPLVKLDKRLHLLELFHGPTLAFKDIGARFMAYAMSYFLEQQHRDLTIIVATSGDTGSAVAHGFFNVPHINVFILYPSGKISRLQEQQMTTLGGNITAVEVEGTFDDCQRLVKQALKDNELQKKRALTTANSINLGRLLPQITYYAWGLIELREKFKEQAQPLVVVPSGNVGNLTAGVYAKWMGTPIRSFIAATNANDVVLQYLHSGNFVPRPSIQTYSNAMDVGNPGNLARLQALYRNLADFRHDVDAVSISDEETLQEIRTTYEKTSYILDPHTAVGVAAARRAMEWMSDAPPIIVAATAHPAKFPDVVKKAIGVEVPLPAALQEAVGMPKHSIKIRGRYSEWKELLGKRKM